MSDYQEIVETDNSNKTLNRESGHRVLRNPGAKAKRTVIKYKCHICREKKEKVLICVNYPICRHTFCHECIDRYFRARAKKEYLKTDETDWPCFFCRGLCRCKRCKKALLEELNQLSSTKKIVRVKNKGEFFKGIEMKSKDKES